MRGGAGPLRVVLDRPAKLLDQRGGRGVAGWFNPQRERLAVDDLVGGKRASGCDRLAFAPADKVHHLRRIGESDYLQVLARCQQPAQSRADDLDEVAGRRGSKLRNRPESRRAARSPELLSERLDQPVSVAADLLRRIAAMTRPWFCMRTARGQARPVAFW